MASAKFHARVAKVWLAPAMLFEANTLCNQRVPFHLTLNATLFLAGDYLTAPEGRCETCLALAALTRHE